MNHTFEAMSFLQKLCDLSPRLAENETKAMNLIKKELDKANVSHVQQSFPSEVPIPAKATLFCDGQEIPCKGCSFVSGKIESNEFVFSSLTPIEENNIPYSINFNPYTDSISTVDFYKHPAVAIDKKDISRILSANSITGEVQVKKIPFTSSNILVGNIKNPITIIVAHVDSLGRGGAVDNGAAVATLLLVLLKNSNLLKDNLFLFSGSEELSYDQLRYDGYGFRVFEEEYGHIIRDAKKILVVDGIGNGAPHWTQKFYLLNVTFQIRKIAEYQEKVFLMQADVDRINRVYHSDLDTIENVSEEYIQKAADLLINTL